MTAVPSITPLGAIGAVALASVFLSMMAVAMGAEPTRDLWRKIPIRPIVAALFIAMVAVPAAAIVLASVVGLQGDQLLGLLLMGISPGAPLAIRRSRQAGADADFALVVQIGVALLAIPAVPGWIVVLNGLYGREADLSVAVLAKQVLIAQGLPLACGFAFRHIAPERARRLVRPLLLASGALILAVTVAIVALLWRELIALPVSTLLASAALTGAALLLAYVLCGPSTPRRMSAGVICALRNPGIALLLASANGVPASAKVVVIAHVLVTACLLGPYLKILQRREHARIGAGRDGLSAVGADADGPAT